MKYVLMNNENFDQKPCKSMGVRKSVGNPSNTTVNSLYIFLKEQKTICGSEVMAYEVKGNSHSKVVL